MENKSGNSISSFFLLFSFIAAITFVSVLSIISFISYISFKHIISFYSVRLILTLRPFLIYLSILTLATIVLITIIITIISLKANKSIIRIKSIRSIKSIVYGINFVIILLYIIVAFIFIYGLIIEPRLPFHFYGRGDRMEVLYCIALSLIIYFLFFVKSYIKICDFYSGNMSFVKSFKLFQLQLNQTQNPIHLFPLVFLFRKYSNDYIVTLDETLIKSTKDHLESNILTGITIGKHDGYFFAWHYDETLELFSLAKILVTREGSNAYPLVNLPIGKEVKFTIEKLRRDEIIWKISVLIDGKYEIIENSASGVKNRKVWGIKINALKNIIIRNVVIKKVKKNIILPK